MESIFVIFLGVACLVLTTFYFYYRGVKTNVYNLGIQTAIVNIM